MWKRLLRGLHCRPLACIAACFVLGVIAGDCVSVPWLACAAAFSGLTGLAVLVRRQGAYCLAAFALGLLLITRALYVPDLPLGAGQTISGRIASEPERTDSALRVTLDRVTVNGESCPCRYTAARGWPTTRRETGFRARRRPFARRRPTTPTPFPTANTCGAGASGCAPAQTAAI